MGMHPITRPDRLLEAPKKWCPGCASFLPKTSRYWTFRVREGIAHKIPAGRCKSCNAYGFKVSKYPDRYGRIPATHKPVCTRLEFYKCVICKTFKYGSTEVRLFTGNRRTKRCKTCASIKHREWRSRNSEYEFEKARAWRQKNPEKVRYYAHKRRIRLSSAGAVSVAPDTPLEVLASEQRGRCFYCYRLVPFRHLTTDHLQPISRNGTHDRENLAAACGSCNSSKHARTLSEYLLWKRDVRGEPLYAPYPPQD